MDGKTDLAAAMPDSGEVVILDGAGNGSFAPGRTVPFTGAQFLAVGEVNRDGLPDLVSATSFDPHVAVLFGRGDGTFNPPPPPAIGSGTTVTAMAVGDLDGDGNVDAVLAVNYPPEALVFRGLGDGTFSEATHNPILSASFAIAMGDFDLDHKTDLAVAESSAGDLLILKGLGGGSFGILGRTVAGKGPVALVASDFNRDGWLDLVSANVGSNDVQVALNQGIPGVTPNRLPAARAGADGTHECTSGEGAEILLDGSESTDPDSTPGTHDDIVLFEWYEEADNSTPVLLGSGERLAVTLPLGAHTITLKVTDAAGASATDSLVLTVADTHGPLLSIDPTPAILWPPDSRLIEVHVSTDASDECGPVSVILESVSSIESGRPGSGGGHGTTGIQGAAFGTADFDFSLRATRAGNGGGLRYLVTYRATDESGNVSRATTFVIVPHDLRRSLPPGTPPVISPGTTLRPPAGASHSSP